uniref:Uncharacterized protein n=1 Tax=Plectus sambesii TaxID=2011161 RepID=A0A914W9X6_9BILA
MWLGYANADCIDQDYSFEYVSHLVVHKLRYPTIPPWTFVANMPASTQSIWAARVHNDSSLDPSVVVNATVKDLILTTNGSRVVINTTIADREGYYVFCMRYPGSADEETCQQCEFVEAQWLLAWKLRDFTVVSQKRSQTWLELEYSKVWDLPFPIFAETTAFVAEKSESKVIHTGPMRSRKTIDLIQTYNFVNLTNLEPGTLYVITANITFNLTIPNSLQAFTPLNLRMPQWAHKSFYTATLPSYDEKRTQRSRPNCSSRDSSSSIFLPVILLLFAISLINSA